MSLLTWIKSLWSKKTIETVKKQIEAAKALAPGLTDEHVDAIVDKVQAINAQPIKGFEKAIKVEQIIAAESKTLKMPEWVRDGFDVLSVVVKLCYAIAKLRGTI